MFGKPHYFLSKHVWNLGSSQTNFLHFFTRRLQKLHSQAMALMEPKEESPYWGSPDATEEGGPTQMCYQCRVHDCNHQGQCFWSFNAICQHIYDQHDQSDGSKDSMLWEKVPYGDINQPKKRPRKHAAPPPPTPPPPSANSEASASSQHPRSAPPLRSRYSGASASSQHPLSAPPLPSRYSEASASAEDIQKLKSLQKFLRIVPTSELVAALAHRFPTKYGQSTIEPTGEQDIKTEAAP